MFTKPPNHKLDTITAHLNINIDDRHRALDDAYASAQIYLILFRLHNKRK